MTDKILNKLVTEFVVGLLKKANINNAGNCFTMCQILQPYLLLIFGIYTIIINTKVKQGRKKVNHFYLLRVKDGIIIDATSSQFKNPNGERMPKVLIGEKPDWYL